MIKDNLINKVQDLVLGSVTTLISSIEDKYITSNLANQYDSALAWYYSYPQFINSLNIDDQSIYFKNGIHTHKIDNNNYAIIATFKIIKESFFSTMRSSQYGIPMSRPKIYYSKLDIPYYLNNQDDNSYSISKTINGNTDINVRKYAKNCILAHETRVIFIGNNAYDNKLKYINELYKTSRREVNIFGVGNKRYCFFKKDLLDYDLLDFEFKDLLPYAINEFYDHANCGGLGKMNILIKSNKNSIPAIEFIAMIYNSKFIKTSSLCMYEAIQEYSIGGSMAAICKIDHLSYDKQLERIRDNTSGLRFYITEENLDEIFEFDVVVEVPEINRTIAEAYCDLFKISHKILDLFKFPISHKTLIEYITECKIKRQ